MPLGLSGSCQDTAMLFFAVFPLFTTVMGDGAEQKKKNKGFVFVQFSVQVEITLVAMERCDAILSNCIESRIMVQIYELQGEIDT